MIKFLVTGLILYFMYKFMFNSSLSEGQKQENIRQEGDIDIRRDNKNPREDRGDFIDYEEVD
ncbi:MAG: hypothetical protein AB8G86_23510 [Saprospiraceae bacterium]